MNKPLNEKYRGKGLSLGDRLQWSNYSGVCLGGPQGVEQAAVCVAQARVSEGPPQ